jgi:hypothetical protein
LAEQPLCATADQRQSINPKYLHHPLTDALSIALDEFGGDAGIPVAGGVDPPLFGGEDAGLMAAA